MGGVKEASHDTTPWAGSPLSAGEPAVSDAARNPHQVTAPPQGNGDQTPSPSQPERFSPELLSIISHELRSPLAAIKGYAATLRRHEQHLSRAERREFLNAIDEASDRLTVIVERILQLSKLEMGLVILDRYPVALSRMVREAVAAAELRLVAMHTPIAFTFIISDAFLATDNATSGLALADARYLRDVVDNLIENAIRYSPNGGTIEITISPGRLAADPAQPALKLTVRDTGIGIADEHLARIFETFQRVDTRSTRVTEGIGLGLAICKAIVERHGGEVSAESVAGEGSSFHIQLPLAEYPDDELE